MSSSKASFELVDAGAVLLLKGNWLIGTIESVDVFAQTLPGLLEHPKKIDASQIEHMDTAGAYLLHLLKEKFSSPRFQIQINGLSEKFQALLELVTTDLAKIKPIEITADHHTLLYRLGVITVAVYQQFLMMCAFLGEIFAYAYAAMIKPIRFQWRSMINEIDVGGYRALPIIAVMMLLIGVVVAYQLGVQLRIYGANVYVVDLSGVSILREFSPMICSVIIAGRTSTSFAALLGTMKVNEEIDALKTMGLSPIERLVLPKILGLLVALPLLVVWGDIFGIIGSMVMAKNMDGISFQVFFERFRQEVAVKHLYLGLIKTPIFALIIAGIGCYQGFLAEGSAESVGARTTKAAVQAIFLIILADGFFSILFNSMNV